MKAIAGHPITVGLLAFIASRIGLSPFVGERVCRDGWASASIGHRGACSWHGGVGGLDHGSWVMPASVAMGVVVGLVWNSVRSKWQARTKPIEEWKPLQAPRRSAPLTRPDVRHSELPPDELERLRAQTLKATEESAAYIAAELARAKRRRDRVALRSGRRPATKKR